VISNDCKPFLTISRGPKKDRSNGSPSGNIALRWSAAWIGSWIYKHLAPLEPGRHLGEACLTVSTASRRSIIKKTIHRRGTECTEIHRERHLFIFRETRSRAGISERFQRENEGTC
jgi:hypothetical protein